VPQQNGSAKFERIDDGYDICAQTVSAVYRL
jgi:hypothetical protein